MIALYDRVYVSVTGQYGRVAQIIKTGIAGVVKYRIEFEGDQGRSGIYGEAFVQPAAPARGIAKLRLAAVNGQVLA